MKKEEIQLPSWHELKKLAKNKSGELNYYLCRAGDNEYPCLWFLGMEILIPILGQRGAKKNAMGYRFTYPVCHPAAHWWVCSDHIIIKIISDIDKDVEIFAC